MGSGVTNFLSVVEARSLGTADIDKITAAIDKQSAALLGLGKSGDKVNEHPGFNAFAEKIKQGIENPLGAISSAAESALKSMGPLGAGIAATGAVFAAASIATFEMAKSLGTYGTEIQNTAIRTGLTTKEVGQFSFAAKVAGQDATVFERAMRGLTMAVTDNSAAGEKGRKWLKEFGVDIVGLKTGTASTSETLVKISEGINGLGSTIERNRALIDIFKRAGIEMAPAILGLAESLQRAKELGFGPSQEDITRFESYHRKVVEIETAWDQVARAIKSATVEAVSFFLTRGTAGNPSGINLTPTAGQAGAALVSATDDTRRPSQLFISPGQAMARFLDENAIKSATALPYGLTPDAYAGATRSRTDSAIDALMGGRSYQEQLKAAEKVLEGLGTPEKGVSTLDEVKEYSAARQKVEALKGKVKLLELTLNKVIGNIEKQTKLYDETTKKESEGGRQLYLNSNGGMPDWAATDRFAFDAANTATNMSWLALKNTPLTEGGTERSERMARETMQWWSGVQDQQAGEGKRELRDARDNERRGMGLYGVQASLGGTSEIDQINQSAMLRKHYADQEYDALRKMADAKDDEQAKQDAADQQHQKYLDAEIERQQALLQMALRQKQEFQSLAVGLFDSILHGGTSSFLKQQAEHLLDQVIGNAAGMAWGDPTKGTGISGKIPHVGDPNSTLGKLLGGTMFGADPTKDLASLKLSGAGDHLITAAVALTDSAHALALSKSSGGGGPLPDGWGGSSSAAGGAGGFGWGDPSIAGGLADLPMNHTLDMGAYAPGVATSGTNANWGKTSSGWGKAVGIGGAAVAGGIGAYQGFSQGGARGDLTGAGSLAGAAGTIMMLAGMTGPAAPIVAGIGLALGLIPSLMGDPKKQRADQLSQEAQQRAYTMPSGADYSMDASGRYSDYDYQGKNRPVQVTNNVYAMDSTSFRDFLIANPGALSSGITAAIAGGNGDDVLGTINRS